MSKTKQISLTLTAAVAAALMFGCNTMNQSRTSDAATKPAAMQSMPAPAPTPAPAPAAKVSAPAAPTPVAAKNVIRIDAGADADFKDPQGNVWKADTGFDGGSTTTRDATVPIAGTDNPDLFRSEHYDMTAFDYKVPNGKYTVNLYFAETWTDASGGDISGPGGRVFSFKVGDQPEVKDFVVTKEGGAVQKAVVKTFQHVNVTNGDLKVTFTPGAVQSTLINAIEIIPE